MTAAQRTSIDDHMINVHLGGARHAILRQGVLLILLLTVAACTRDRGTPIATTILTAPTVDPTTEPVVHAVGPTLAPDPTSTVGQTGPSFHGLIYDPIEPAPNFAAIDQQRQPVELTDLRGNVVLLYFGFINCPDACPLTLADWQLVHHQLGAAAEQVRFVFMTVDPVRDRPEIMAQYLGAFHEDFIGLWAELDEVESIARDYNVFMEQVEVDSAVGYVVNHTTLTFLIDQSGQLVAAYPVDSSAADITADVTRLLNRPLPVAVAPTTLVTSPLAITPTVDRELHATDPATVNLAAGRPQFIELFAYW